ncbi:respiratory nitrate reductase subunit gamma [Actinokineospora auranticolor]|uniref:Nitrate reductase-like protein NarX n=1 Tax=Actinokineospora auranticolor TaxID=155976 RepID=A0A2S6H0V7_9PSEU|nr:respiratory nitrate reductase subunit gamma [Actinokineospora auranticolor]PPK71112.1 nitrate reductase gamma subunit [Actinokineospora auranticolor]
MTGVLLWAVLPYLTIAVFALGLTWRFRHDRFGWTTRSSQLHESRLLRIGSPLFHFGLLFVIGGHVAGLLVPASVTRWLGVPDELYHLLSLTAGTVTGAATIAGLGVLLYRRLRTPAVRRATTSDDRVTYLALGGTLLLGMSATVLTNGLGGGYDYRATISPWFRGILFLQPDPSLMDGVPLPYRLHALFAMALFMLWPFSRLVHAFSAPVRYLARPYVVYRSRDDRRLAARAPRRGWDDA